MAAKKRNYRKEYDNYQGKAVQKKRRAKRNTAAAKKGSKGDGKDVHHIDNNPNNNDPGNLIMQSPGKNRSFPRNKKAGKK